MSRPHVNCTNPYRHRCPRCGDYIDSAWGCHSAKRYNWKENHYRRVIALVPDERTERSFYSYKEQCRQRGVQPDWDRERVERKRRAGHHF